MTIETQARIDRRHALALAGAAALSPFVWKPAFAASTFKAGAIDVTILSDGHMTVGLDRLSSGNADDIRRTASITGDTLPFPINVAMLSVGGKRVLIDSGAGGTWVNTAGRLSDALTGAGIDPATIDQVVLTHCHPDHLWGLIDDFEDSLRFPNAKVAIPDAEFDFWMSKGKAEAAGAAVGAILGARRVLGRIADRLTRVKPDDEPAPGVAYVPAPGHTPGQCAVLASSGTEHVLFSADTIFHPVVSVAHPEWRPAQDMDGARAVETRRRMLDIAAAKKALVVAYHVATPGAGRIEKTGTGYAWRNA